MIYCLFVKIFQIINISIIFSTYNLTKRKRTKLTASIYVLHVTINDTLFSNCPHYRWILPHWLWTTLFVPFFTDKMHAYWPSVTRKPVRLHPSSINVTLRVVDLCVSLHLSSWHRQSRLAFLLWAVGNHWPSRSGIGVTQSSRVTSWYWWGRGLWLVCTSRDALHQAIALSQSYQMDTWERCICHLTQETPITYLTHKSGVSSWCFALFHTLPMTLVKLWDNCAPVPYDHSANFNIVIDCNTGLVFLINLMDQLTGTLCILISTKCIHIYSNWNALLYT